MVRNSPRPNSLLKGSRRLAIPPRFKWNYGFSDGYAAVAVSDSGSGIIDTTGRTVVPFIYEETENFQEGLARVKLGGRWGFVDTAGREVIKPQFDDVSPFYNGRAVAVNSARWNTCG